MAKEVSIVVDLNYWTMQDLQNFTAAVSANDFEAIAPLAAKAITQWPYEGDVGSPETWAKLPLPAVAKTLKTVRKAVESVFAEGN